MDEESRGTMRDITYGLLRGMARAPGSTMATVEDMRDLALRKELARYGADTEARMLAESGVPEPETRAGRIVEGVTTQAPMVALGAPAAVGTGGLSGLMAEMALGGVGLTASETAREYGAGGLGQFMADVGSQMVTPGLAAKGLATSIASAPIAKPLLVQHNLTKSNLMNAERIGGLPMPSMAVVRADQPGMTGYGDISLLAGSDMAKPSARNPVFSSDAYSPRYPTVHVMTSSGDMDKIQRALGEPFGAENLWRAPRDSKGRDYVYFEPESNLRDVGAEQFLEHDAVKARFLWERGEMPTTEGQPDSFEWKKNLAKGMRGREFEYNEWKSGFLDRLGVTPERKIFVGFTDLGNRRYKPETIENVVKEMKKEMRGADGSASIYGAGVLRAHVAPRFRTMKQIKDARARIESPETVAVYKDAMNDKMMELVGRVHEYARYKDANQFISQDNALNNLVDVAAGRSSWDEFFDGVPQGLRDDVSEYVEELRSGPTEYFEIKPKRAVDIGEFNVALVPADSDQRVSDVLKKHGVRVEKYTDESDRAARIAKQRDLFFSFIGGSVLAGSALRKGDEVRDESSLNPRMWNQLPIGEPFRTVEPRAKKAGK